MGSRSQKRSKIEAAKRKILPACGGIATLLMGIIAVSSPAFAEPHVLDSVSQSRVNVEVLSACSMETTNNIHNATIVANTYSDHIGDDTVFRIYCNDNEGYSVYAIGNSSDTEGNNRLIGNNEESISTGVNTNGDTSSWSFKLTSNSAGLTIQPDYANFAMVPNKWALVARRLSGTVGINDKDSFNATYATYISGKQKIGTYSGQVKYAMFHPNANHPTKTIEDITYMQEFKKLDSFDMEAVLESMEQDRQYELKDKRDNKTYYVAKLVDGKVWMTENLDFNLSISKQLTPDDTDIQTNWTPGTATTTGTTWDAGSAGYNKNMSYDPGDKCWNGTIYDAIDNNGLNTRTTACSQHDKSHYHIGNYYSWSAAVAMNDTSGYNVDKTDVDQSICPAGWRLSKYDGTGSFNDLRNKTKFTSGHSGNIQKDPYYFVYGGFWARSNTDVGYSGYYWSSVVTKSSMSYRMLLTYNGTLHLQSANGRDGGFSVRCVARSYAENNRKTINNIKNMQDFKILSDEDKNDVISSMQQDQQYELTDSRDGKVYYVAKLADGNVWMTENLDFDLSTNKQLTPDDTDIKANWTPSASTHATSDTTWGKSDYNTPQSYDPGNKCWTGTITTNGGPVTSATYGKDCSPHDPSHYHIGNYYSWTAAVAMSNTSSYTTDKTDVDQSICPAGWRLSKYEGTGSFKDLQTKTSFTSGTSGTIHKNPYYFVYGGLWGGTSGSVGGNGRYWSSVVIADSHSYSVYFHSSGDLNPQINSLRHYGATVRCVVR